MFMVLLVYNVSFVTTATVEGLIYLDSNFVGCFFYALTK